MARISDPRRGDDRNRIWEALFDTFITLNTETAEQTVDLTKISNGIITRILMSIDTNTNGVGATLTIDDADGFEIFNSGLKAQGADYIMDTDIPFKGITTIGYTPGGNPGADSQIVTVKLMGE